MPDKQQLNSAPQPEPATRATYRTHPVLFSPTMVRALIDGAKTETRRLVSSPLANVKLGDRLWVRETGHASFRDDAHPDRPTRPYYDTPKKIRAKQHAQDIHFYEDEKRKEQDLRFSPLRWIPSIHMYRWASRLTLIVKGVRFCRLQEITEAEAIAGGSGVEEVPGRRAHRHPPSRQDKGVLPGQFGRHWDSLYRKPGSRLADNPEVVSLRFTVHN